MFGKSLTCMPDIEMGEGGDRERAVPPAPYSNQIGQRVSCRVVWCVVLFSVVLVVFFLKSRLHSNGDGDGDGGGKGYSERGLGLKKHDAASMSGWDLRALLASNWPSPNRQTTGRELKRLCHLQTARKTLTQATP